MAKYLLLTFVLNVITILVTVIIINVYFRSPTTHRMPQWVRVIFLECLPRFMCMKKPKSATREQQLKEKANKSVAQVPGLGNFDLTPPAHHPFCPSADEKTVSVKILHTQTDQVLDPSTNPYYPLSPEALKAIDAIEYITEHLRRDEEYKMYRDDWKFVAMLIDRMLLYIFFAITLGGTLGILLSAPNVFNYTDQRKMLEHLIMMYKMGGTGAK